LAFSVCGGALVVGEDSRQGVRVRSGHPIQFTAAALRTRYSYSRCYTSVP
jgi:hypothetical protein